jgi:NhaP-type Na+/H+ or K+/H+ antiporter
MESRHDTDDDVLRAQFKPSTLIVITAMLCAVSLYVMAFVRVPFDKVYFECPSVVCFLAAAILTPISAIAALSNVAGADVAMAARVHRSRWRRRSTCRDHGHVRLLTF